MSADYALSRLFCSEPELTYVTPQNTRQRRIQRSAATGSPGKRAARRPLKSWPK